jgi:two-component system, LytTR family, sensor kinase
MPGICVKNTAQMAGKNPLRFYSFWQLQAIGWGSFYLLQLAESIAPMHRPGGLREPTLTVGFMLLGSCALRYACRSLSRRSLPWLSLEWRAAAWCLVVGTVSAFGAELAILGIREITWARHVPNTLQFTFMFFMWSNLYFSIKQWQQSVHERERLLHAETEVREVRLRALRYQLNPHFLFNSLNAVSTLVLDGNAAAATRMLAQISDLLRTSLDEKVTPEIALSQELAFTEQYIAIEQTRLGDRLRVEFAIRPETLDALVPSMLLQPLVENAVRHGVAPLVEGGRIAIESDLHDTWLRLVISNSGRRGSERQTNAGTGIGQSNTAARLETLYGSNHKFWMEWPEGGGCRVTVELPFRPAVREQGA